VIWINAYFLTDPQNIIFDDRELVEVLSEIESILDTTQLDDVLITADMNWDMTHQSGFALSVEGSWIVSGCSVCGNITQ
jgi:hypothetical protein